MMARFPLLACLFLLTLSASFRLSQGACHQAGAIPMCQSGTTTNQTIYLEASTDMNPSEQCNCTITASETGNLEIFPITGSTIPGCNVRVWFNRQVGNLFHHVVSCPLDDMSERQLPANSQLNVRMATSSNDTGTAFIDVCLYLWVPRGTLTVSCTPREGRRSTPAPPTTQPPPTTPTQRPPVTTPTPQPGTPTAQPGTPTAQPGTPTAQPGTPTAQPGTPTAQPGTPTAQPGTPTAQPGTPTAQPGTPTAQPGTPTAQPGTPTAQPGTPTAQPGTPTAQPGTPTAQPGTPTQQPATTAPPMPGSTEGFARFPVPEVAGGVAGGILLIILLVVCITCCTSRSRSRRADEESLKSHESQSPVQEMQETGKDGYAFDNILYHASQKDEGKDGSGKSLTPTVSEGSTHDDSAVKGFEELYASVNKNITEFTDIM